MRVKKCSSKTQYELTRKAYSYVLVLAMIATIIVTPLGGLGLWMRAEESQICDHEHTEECYAVPEDHVCSIEAGCTPIYSMKTVEVGEPHVHDDSCYGVMLVEKEHMHDEECYDRLGEELGTLICGYDDSEEYAVDYDNRICGKEAGEVETMEVPNEDAGPIGWECSAEPILTCSHMNCEYGQPCLGGGILNLTKPAA